jgi:N-acetylglucosaminyl-diphospho-decaprenol L-rhamnosyltransferase
MSSFDLSILIVSYNVRDYLLACIASIKKYAPDVLYEIIVVDNNSSDNSADVVEKAYPDVLLIRNAQNLGFARANNQAYEKSRGEFVLLLNPDTEVQLGAIQTVLEFMKKEKTAGIAGCRNVGPDGSLQKSITSFPSVLRNLAQAFFIDRLLFSERKHAAYYRPAPFKADSVGGAFMMVRREPLGSDTLLNSDYFMYSEEKDLALRLLRKGWTTWFVPGAEIVHYGGKSTDQMPMRMFLELHKSQIRYFRIFNNTIELCLSWWLVLVSGMVASLPFCFTRCGRNRFKLFFAAAAAYPKLWRDVAGKN